MTDTSTQEQPTATITTKDRCDLCSAQAYVHVYFEVGDLMFCNHHYHKGKDKIDSIAVEVVDESWQLSDARLDVSA